jgi:hypothetical protein
MTRRERNLRKWVPNIWAYLNVNHFGGQLPKPRFYYTGKLGTYAKDFAGLQWTGPKGRHCMAIDPNSVETRVQALTVVAHEMIHQLQLLQCSERTQREHHSRFFLRHAARLNAAGIPVTIEYYKLRTH